MEILIIAFFVILNGFFSMAEISVISTRKSKLEARLKKGDKTAESILKVLESPDKFLSTIQVAITTIGMIIGLYTGESYVQKLSSLFVKLNIDASLATIIARVIIVMAATFFMLIFGELVPKRIGMGNPEKIAGFIIRPMNFISKLVLPFVWILSKTTSLIAKLLGVKNVSPQKATEEEIKSIIDDSVDAGEIEETEQDIVNRVFDLDGRKIESLMTPRKELAWFEKEAVIGDIINDAYDKIHYIYPVCNKNLDDIQGVLYIKDVFPVEDKKHLKVKDLMRECQFFHESISIYNMLEEFKKTGIHYAFIIDEFGMVQGMITMNDILEAIVGNTSESESGSNQEFVRRQDGSYLIDGQYPFYDFLSHFDLEDEYQKHNYNTLSGLILAITGKVPSVGQKIEWKNFIFEIVDIDTVRIDKVLVVENKIKKES